MDATVNMPALMTTDELAAYLKLTGKTLRDWRYKGIGPRSIKVGGAVRYRAEDVSRWIAEQSGADGTVEVAGKPAGVEPGGSTE